jgi:hypothetical protein
MFNCLAFNVSEVAVAVTTTDWQTCQDILSYVNRSACSQSITNDFGYNFPFIIDGGCGYDYAHIMINATKGIDGNTIPQCIQDIINSGCGLLLNSPKEAAVFFRDEVLLVSVFIIMPVAITAFYYGCQHKEYIRDRCSEHSTDEETRIRLEAAGTENKGCLQKAAGLIGNCWAGLWGRTTSEIRSNVQHVSSYGSIQADSIQDEGNKYTLV